MLPPLHLLSLREGANADVPTGVLPRKGNARPGADRLNVILKSQHDLQKKVNKYREGRLSHELNYANDGPVGRQLTKEQKANLESERNHLECPNPDCSNPDVQVEPDGRAVCQHCGAEVAKFASETNDENSSRNVVDNAGEERQARLHAAEEERARLEIHEAGNAPVRDSLTSARANLPGHGAQPLRPASAPALEQVRVGQVYSRTVSSPSVPHVRLPADPVTRRLQPASKAPAQKEEDAYAARVGATATAATRADQMQGLQAGEVHVQNKASASASGPGSGSKGRGRVWVRVRVRVRPATAGRRRRSLAAAARAPGTSRCRPDVHTRARYIRGARYAARGVRGTQSGTGTRTARSRGHAPATSVP